MSQPDAGEVVVEEREEGGRHYKLVRHGEAYEVLLDGKRVCASNLPRNEEQLVELAMAPLRGRDDVTVLLAGLGSGRTLRHVLDARGVRVTRVEIVEASQVMIDWGKQYFAATDGDALLDPRVKLHHSTLDGLVKQVRLGGVGLLPEEGVMALILDMDEGPDAPSRPGNEAHYTDEGLAALEQVVRPGGVITVWSAKREPELGKRLAAHFQNVAEVAVPNDWQDGLDYVYRARRSAPQQSAAPSISVKAN